jgi:UDP-N-acetylmuramoylalanine--D-glutamate ligase
MFYLQGLQGFDAVFPHPGMKKSLPEIALARERGAVVTTDIALFLDRCKARVCGITGTIGKTPPRTPPGIMLRESLRI